MPAVAGAILTRVIHSMTAPRRARPGATAAQSGPAAGRGDWSHLAGLAFAELIEHLPTDRLHSKTAATVVITLDHDKLAAAVGVGGLDTGDVVSAGDPRRLACGAGLVPRYWTGRACRWTWAAPTGCSPSTNGSHSRPDTRPVQRRVRAALPLVRAPSPRSVGLGGRSDLADAVPLCGFHHRRIHDPGYHHRFATGGVTFHRRT